MSKEVHGDRYGYELVEYKSLRNPVMIRCKEHGVFMQNPIEHLHGQGCPKCSMSKIEADFMKLLEEKGIEYEHQKHFDFLRKAKS